jgi:hypothetical protein
MPLPIPIEFARHADASGWLSVYQSGERVPFTIKRVFVVSYKPGFVGGNHAHKRCAQLLVCVHGQIRVRGDDGVQKFDHLLDSANTGLLLLPGTWAAQEYLCEGATLMVLCDREYEAHDYIRDYAEFELFCRTQQSVEGRT